MVTELFWVWTVVVVIGIYTCDKMSSSYDIHTYPKKVHVKAGEITDVEKKCMDTKGVQRGRAMNWEIGIDIYTLICTK